MENQEIGTICVLSLCINPKYLTIYSTHRPKSAIIWDIFEKNPYHMSIVHDFYYKGPT